MVLASHHVVKELLDAADVKEAKNLMEICKKFCSRYPKDEELLGFICGEKSLAETYFASKDEAVLKKLKAELHRLWSLRQLESAGGENLWFKDRRP
jgi:hypothetical protein